MHASNVTCMGGIIQVGWRGRCKGGRQKSSFTSTCFNTLKRQFGTQKTVLDKKKKNRCCANFFFFPIFIDLSGHILSQKTTFLEKKIQAILWGVLFQIPFKLHGGKNHDPQKNGHNFLNTPRIDSKVVPGVRGAHDGDFEANFIFSIFGTPDTLWHHFADLKSLEISSDSDWVNIKNRQFRKNALKCTEIVFLTCHRL